ncbi:FAD-binding oxidoreductase [Seonamhaeicola aphaedonensis]|uniref:FAD/FMN-containing dehydrogenase n=1 Tax=Seonamhaeicola aphaedonensis TaxID=1461338 RepID=A0A3D9HKW4_9FLAO|nr:FAD-binding oxidoreductase [Seonamhaeicola aphaedonensis]RED50113.1 FAD/FMN-containing dehydrogenase [Seonamhaeicola aphaedonensis]
MIEEHIKQIEQKLGVNKVLIGEKVKERYEHIWEMDKPLCAKAVVFPSTTQDVSDILTICHKYHQPIVVHGGLTNLTGSTETNADELVICMEKMNVIEELDVSSRTITVQSGVILESIHQEVEKEDLLFPINFGAEGSAQIGGVIATNAGGLRVLRYGMTRNLVLGLEVVMADGTIISSMKKIIKDNSGYDLKQFFIGSEGTLGVITKAVLRLQQKPKSRNSAFVAINDFNKVIAFLKFIDSGLAGTLSGYELLWERNFKAMTNPSTNISKPLPYGYKYYVLIESLGSDYLQDQQRLESLLEEALMDELILDAALPQSVQHTELFWRIREDVDILVSQCNNVQNFDVSLPVSEIGTYVDAIFNILNKIPEIDNFFAHGHVADGNIHFLISKSNNSTELIDKINNIIYTPLTGLGGSVSAEHGIGIHKKPYLKFCRSIAEIQLMQLLKTTMDSRGILNRNKILDHFK